MIEKKLIAKIICIAIIIGIVITVIPIIINCLYLNGLKTQIPPNTMFSANDLLGYFGALLTFIGTAILGVTTLIQNSRLHKTNLEIEKENSKTQLLMAQDAVPFFALENFIISTPKESEVNSLKHKPNCVDLSIDITNRYKTYTLLINKCKPDEAHNYCLEASFTITNKSRARINSLEFFSITLEKRISPKNEKLIRELIDVNYIDNNIVSINSIIMPEESIKCKLLLIFDSENLEIFSQPMFNAIFELQTIIITGIEYREKIYLMSHNGVVLPLKYKIDQE